jgi:probable HAF family extracellular repeat protein
MNDIPDEFSDLGATQAHAFLWQKGVMQDLGTLGGPDSGSYAINERGQVVGWALTDSINSFSGLPVQDPFFWDGTRMIDLGSFGGTTAVAVDLNNRGQVIGNALLQGDEIHRAFLWPGRGGKMIKLPTLGGTLSEAKAINTAGDVTGAARLPGDTLSHPVLWTKGKVIDLGVVPGDLCAEGMAINSKQQIVGFSNHEHCFPPHAHGFLWENGVLFDLNQLISNKTTLTVIEGVRITELGEIAGNALTPEGNSRGVVLIPCDEHHPNIDDCDYEEVDESVASQASPAPLHTFPADEAVNHQRRPFQETDFPSVRRTQTRGH